MGNEFDNLNLMAAKLNREIKILEDQMIEAKRRLGIVSEAILMLKNEGYSGQEVLFADRPKISQKYKDKKMGEAIEDILKLASGQKLTVETIIGELTSNGYESPSKDLRRDLYTCLYRLTKRNRISLNKEGKLNKYFIEEETNEK